jgi:hypothetical protein
VIARDGRIALWVRWLGSATSTVGIGNAYYPDNRTLGGNTSRALCAVGIDAASMVLRNSGPTSSASFTNDRVYPEKPDFFSSAVVSKVAGIRNSPSSK